MKRTLLLLVFIIKGAYAQEQNLADFVNPLIGTSGKTPVEYRGNVPAVVRPFGMNQWTALTRENFPGKVAYHYTDTAIKGFTSTHQPAIWMGEYGNVTLMPNTGSIKVTLNDRQLPYKHSNEIAKPYYYKVELEKGNAAITTEMAATSRCAAMKFTFPDNNEVPYVVVDAIRSAEFKGKIYVDTVNNVVWGSNPDRRRANRTAPLPNYNMHFYIKFDKKIKSFGTYNNNSIKGGSSSEEGNFIGSYVTFEPGAVVNARIATSFISQDQARKNLSIEIPKWDFNKVVEQCKKDWNKELSKIQVDASNDDKINLYTAMYQAFLYPREFSEYGKYYSGADDKIHEGVFYNDFSLWDTFRSEHPLLVLLQPKRTEDMINSMLQIYDQSGRLPLWFHVSETNVMIGTHSNSVIADAYIKGVRGFDLKKAYEACLKDADTPPIGDTVKTWHPGSPWPGSAEARWGLTYLKKLGYVPQDKVTESVSRTLEYSFDDFCVAQLAKATGDTSMYRVLIERSISYKNLYNKVTGQMHPRNADGTWFHKPLEGFTEGSPWTYLFCAMQDIPGLINLMGGADTFAAKLDSNFKGGHYRHDNEPGHHYGYLYNYCGQPWKTQEVIANILSKNYPIDPANGPYGNEDCGQMSSWYIFSSLGFYPVTPGSDVYAIGTPHYKKAVMNLGKYFNNKKFTVLAENLSETNIYVQSATIDGKLLAEPFLKHQDLIAGKTLKFIMGSTPNKNWK